MGWDIYGWVEVRPTYYTEDRDAEQPWMAVVDIGHVMDRNYDAYGCIFGVQNYAQFEPLAFDRGIPANASEMVKDELATATGEADSAFRSWITWAELAEVDWEELSVHPDSRLHRYVRNESGELVFEGKSKWNRRFAQHVFPARVRESISDPPAIYEEGQEWVIDGVIYRAEKLRRKDVLTQDWRVLFEIMESLSRIFGKDGVRVVVWFAF